MNWLNKNISELLEFKEIQLFLSQNNLQYKIDNDILCIYNANILIRVYEELGYLHLDFYDVLNLKWSRDLDHVAISKNVIPLSEAKKIYFIFENKFYPEYSLSKKSIVSCLTRFNLIDRYMKDLLCGATDKYISNFEEITPNEHLKEIINFKNEAKI